MLSQDQLDAELAKSPAKHITPEIIKDKIAKAEYATFNDTTLTICVLTLVNGFTVVGKSACASPENYNKEIGEKVAFDDAFRQIWPLEGYLLKQELYMSKGWDPQPAANEAVAPAQEAA